MQLHKLKIKYNQSLNNQSKNVILACLSGLTALVTVKLTEMANQTMLVL